MKSTFEGIQHANLISWLIDNGARFDESDCEAKVNDVLETDDIVVMAYCLPKRLFIEHSVLARAAKEEKAHLVKVLIQRGADPLSIPENTYISLAPHVKASLPTRVLSKHAK